MLRVVAGLAVALLMIPGTQAQDTARLDRAVARLSSPITAADLETLGETDPNAYVYFLQDYLRDKGNYSGEANGQLTNATIRAIVEFCRESGVANVCVRGPLLPEAIAAVSEAVAAALAPVAEEPAPAVKESAAADVAPMAEEAAVAPAAEPEGPKAPPQLPDGWRLNDNGGRGTIGIAVELVSAGENAAVLHLAGTAARDGYFNIELTAAAEADPGTWTTAVSAGRESAEGSAGTVWLRTGQYADTTYSGELFEGVRIDADADPALVSGTGEPSAETTRLLPYVQLTVRAGDVVDTTLDLSDPSLARTD